MNTPLPFRPPASISLYENHAQDFRVKPLTGGGMQHDRIKRGELTWKHGQQPARPVRISCYENHATDARIKDISVAPTGGASHNGRYDNKNPLILIRFSND